VTRRGRDLLAVAEACVHGLDHVLEGEPVDKVLLGRVAHLGIDHPIRRQVLYALAGNTVKAVDGLHDGQRLVECLEIALERPGVCAVTEPGAERIGVVSRKPLVANGFGELEDCLWAQSAIEVVMQERLRDTAQGVVGEGGVAERGVGESGVRSQQLSPRG